MLTKHDIDWFEAQYLVAPARADGPAGIAIAGRRVCRVPPALIATAGFDPLRDEGEQYAAALRAAGTPVDLRSLGSLTHAFATLFPLGGGSAVATTELISALRAHLSRV